MRRRDIWSEGIYVRAGKLTHGIASSKGDDETLEELDWFRFVTAPNKYMKREGDETDVPLEKDDVVRLVKWKL